MHEAKLYVSFYFVINEWNKLKSLIHSLSLGNLFSIYLGNGCRLFNPIYNIFNPISLKYLTRFHLELSNLNEQKFKHDFQDCINPLSTCSLKTKSNSHFFFCCRNYFTLRAELMNDLKTIDENILRLPENYVLQLLLFGDPKCNFIHNCQILNDSINFILKSERFKGSIM